MKTEKEVRIAEVLFLLGIVAIIFALSATAASDEIQIQVCDLMQDSASSNNYVTACSGSYPASCGAGANDRITCDDGNSEAPTVSAASRYAGVRVKSDNTSVTNCASITEVSLCYEWWTSNTNINNCGVYVDANGGASYSTVTAVCPSTSANPGLTCANVTSLESWTCNTFFSASPDRGWARTEWSSTNTGSKTHTVDALFFNVTYTTTPCGTITSSTTLTQNETFAGNCFTIGANNLVIDGAGYTLTGNGSGVGVALNGFNNITIRNMTILNFTHGVNASNAINITIVNNTINTTSVSSISNANAISLTGVERPTVTSNWLYTTRAPAEAVDLQHVSSGTFNSNTIITSGGGSTGFSLNQNVTTSAFTSNTITTSGTSAHGFSIYSGGTFNNISSNTITVSTASSGSRGVEVNYANDTRIVSNIINSDGEGVYLYGSKGSTDVLRTVILDNVITATGTSSGHGIRLGTTFNIDVNDTEIRNNNITATVWYEIYDQTNSTAMINRLYYNNSFGAIIWTDTSNGGFLKNLTLNVTSAEGLGLGHNLFIGDNIAAINSSAISEGRITTTNANVSLTGLTLGSVTQIIKDSNYRTDKSQVSGSNCIGSGCSLTSYAGGTAEFTTTSFSSFTASDAAACGTITSNTNMTANLSATGDCFTIGASNILITGNGYALLGNGSGVGVSINGYNNITIQNVTMLNFTHGVNASNAINLTIANSTINTTTVSGINNAYPVFLTSVMRPTVTRNWLYSNTQPSQAVYLQHVSSGTFNSNTIITSGGGSTGFQLQQNVTTSVFNSNTITTTGTSADGIQVYGSSTLNNFTSNTITVSTSSSGSSGFDLTNSNSSRIEGNTISSDGEGVSLYGFPGSSETKINTIIGNVITSTGTTNGHAIRIGMTGNIGANDTEIRNNNLTATFGYEIYDLTNDSYVNRLYYNNSFGSIIWTDTSNGGFLKNLTLNVTSAEGIGLGRNLFIGDNIAAINSSAISEGRITTTNANVSLTGLTLGSVTQIIKDSNYRTDKSQVSGSNCIGSGCSLTSYAGGTAEFTTTSFSSFTASDAAACGTITSNTNMTANLSATGDCFTIGASNILITGNGYALLGNGSGVGVSINGYNNITIQNVTMLNFTHGVNATNAINLTIANNTINTTTVSVSNPYAINLDKVEKPLVTRNWLYTTRAPAQAVYLQHVSSGTFSSNTIITSGGGSTGFQLQQNVTTSVFNSNTITATGTNAHGMSVYSSSTSNNITSNTFTVSTTSSGSRGVEVNSASDIRIIGNTINSDGEGIFMYGNAGSSEVWRTAIINNVITATGSSSGHGIRLGTTFNIFVNDSEIRNNNITATFGYEIFDMSNSSVNVNWLYYNNSFGSITWTDTANNGFLKNLTLNITSGEGIGLGRNLFIGDNIAALNSSAVSEGRIATTNANVSLTGLTLGSVTQITKDSNYRTNKNDVTGSNCMGSTCINISYSGGILLFNTTSFSSFTAQEVTSECATVNADTTLTQNSSATGNCFVINTSNVVLNGAGYTVTGDGTSSGVVGQNFSNITVKNIILINFSWGVNLSRSVNHTIFNNTIRTINSSTDKYGIFFFNINTSNITSNAIYTYANTSHTIHLEDSNNNTVSSNTLNTTAFNGLGIILLNSSNYNQLRHNNIRTSGGEAHGFVFEHTSSNNNATNDSIFLIGSNSYGIYFSNGTSNMVINGSLNSTNSNDVRVYYGSGAIVNGVFNSSDIGFDVGTGNVSVRWYVTVNVTNTSVTGQQNAAVTSYNRNNVQQQATSTSSSGFTTHTLQEFDQNSTNKTYTTPHTINTTLSGYVPNSTQVNLTVTQTTTLHVILSNDGRPSVTNGEPAANSQFNVSNAIRVAADATDDVVVGNVSANITYPNGTVTILQLRLSSGNTYNNTFTVPILLGTYNITFVANDSIGNINSSVTSNFTVNDVVKPNVTDVKPATGSVFIAGDILNISANVTDDVAVSVVKANVTLPNGTVSQITLSLSLDTKYNNTYTVPSASGTYNITIIANDTSNNINQTQMVQFTVADIFKPSVFDTAPTAGTQYNISNIITLSANVTDDAAVRNVSANITYPNGTVSIVQLILFTGNKYNNTFTAPVLLGTYNITFVANDSTGNINSSITSNFIVNDVTLPNVTDVKPVNGSSFAVGDVLNISANVTDNINVSRVLANVTLPNGTVNQITLNLSIDTKYNNTFTVPLLSGIYNATIIANDTSNNINQSQSVLFTVPDTVKPSVPSITPAANSQFNVSGSISIGANANDDVAIDKVKANLTYPNGSTTLLSLNQVEGPYAYANSLVAPALIGNYNITFIANDTSGNVNDSVKTNFTVNDVVKPGVVDLKPVNGSSFVPGDVLNISANVTDDVAVSVVKANVTLPNSSVTQITLSLSTDAKYNNTFTVPLLGGTYNITIIANDTSNNINSTQTTNFTVANTIRPSVFGIVPTAGSQYNISNSITLVANVTDDIAVGNVSANITLPDLSITIIQLRLSSGERYNATFTGTTQRGAYLITYVANDTAGNINSSITSNFTVNDVVKPSIFDTAPASGTAYNVSNQLNFYANITDDVGLDIARVNITYPNGTSELVTLNSLEGGDNRRAGTTNAPAVIGVYNVTFFANDTSGNVNDSVRINITVNDVAKPSVVDVKPINGSNFTAGDILNISANVTDDVAVSVVKANITLPNSSVTQVTLSLSTGAKYNNTFTVPLLGGTYNLTIVANDTSNNINQSQSVLFVVPDSVKPGISGLIPSNGTMFNTSVSIQIAANVTDDVNVSKVIANVTYPNGTITALSLTLVAGTSKYNNSLLLPNLTGQYNFTIIANDTTNNVNSSTGTFNATIPDADGDGVDDRWDSFVGNSSLARTTGVSNLVVKINGSSTINGTFTNLLPVEFLDGTTPILNFTFNFTSRTLDLRNLSIVITSTSVVVNTSGMLGTSANKTLFIIDSSFASLCVRDAEIASDTDISSACTGTNETDFDTCIGASGVTINNIICTDLGTIIRIENLSHSGVEGAAASSEAEGGTSGGSAAPGGTGGGGFVPVRKTAEEPQPKEETPVEAPAEPAVPEPEASAEEEIEEREALAGKAFSAFFQKAFEYNASLVVAILVLFVIAVGYVTYPYLVRQKAVRRHPVQVQQSLLALAVRIIESAKALGYGLVLFVAGIGTKLLQAAIVAVEGVEAGAFAVAKFLRSHLRIIITIVLILGFAAIIYALFPLLQLGGIALEKPASAIVAWISESALALGSWVNNNIFLLIAIFLVLAVVAVIALALRLAADKRVAEMKKEQRRLLRQGALHPLQPELQKASAASTLLVKITAVISHNKTTTAIALLILLLTLVGVRLYGYVGVILIALEEFITIVVQALVAYGLYVLIIITILAALVCISYLVLRMVQKAKERANTFMHQPLKALPSVTGKPSAPEKVELSAWGTKEVLPLEKEYQHLNQKISEIRQKAIALPVSATRERKGAEKQERSDRKNTTESMLDSELQELNLKLQGYGQRPSVLEPPRERGLEKELTKIQQLLQGIQQYNPLHRPRKLYSRTPTVQEAILRKELQEVTEKLEGKTPVPVVLSVPKKKLDWDSELNALNQKLALLERNTGGKAKVIRTDDLSSRNYPLNDVARGKEKRKWLKLRRR